MGERIHRHIRSNVVGYVAVFIALSGTAYAVDGPLPGQNQVGSADIIDGEVKTPDVAPNAVGTGKINDGGVQSPDIRDGAVESADVLDDSLRSEDIFDGQIRAIDVAFNTLRGDEIQDGTLGSADLADNDVKGDDVDESTLFNDNSLTTADLADDSVGRGELGPNSVRASELGDALVDRPDPTPTLIDGGAAHNGAYNTGQSTASCNAGEELIGAYGKWTNVPDLNAELFISGVSLDHAAESATVSGGNDSGDDSNLVAVATCLAV